MQTDTTTQLVDQLINDRAIAHFATVAPDGRPHVTPMWFGYDAGVFWFISPRDADKVSHLRITPQVAVSISDQAPPYRSVMITGRAEIVSDATELTQKLQQRYLGDQTKELSFTDENSNVAIKVTPEHIESWASH